MVKAKKWTLAKNFNGFPKAENFKMVEEELPALEDGDVMVEVLFLSVDSYMRRMGATQEIGSTMFGGNVGKVIESRHPDYPIGCHVVTYTGWTDRAVVNPAKNAESWALPMVEKCPEFSGIPKSFYLGMFGMPGLTAYFGFLRVLDPKPGETVLVNAAAGMVGSLVGQIAKLQGCTVIGSAGTDDKVKWLKDELGFHHAFNYKSGDMDEKLKELAPDGIDYYFDNVGGNFTYRVITHHMKYRGRVSVCGAIDTYNDTDHTVRKEETFPPMQIVMKNLQIEGFGMNRWISEFQDAINIMHDWYTQGKLKYKEHVTDGFEKMPAAFGELFAGKNTGKAIVKV